MTTLNKVGEYHKCAKASPTCAGLNKGISGYHACAKLKKCGANSAKPKPKPKKSLEERVKIRLSKIKKSKELKPKSKKKYKKGQREKIESDIQKNIETYLYNNRDYTKRDEAAQRRRLQTREYNKIDRQTQKKKDLIDNAYLLKALLEKEKKEGKNEEITKEKNKLNKTEKDLIDTINMYELEQKEKQLTELQKKQLENEKINLIEEEKGNLRTKVYNEVDRVMDPIISKKDIIIKILKKLKKTDITKFKEQKKIALTQINDLLKSLHNDLKLLSNKHINNRVHMNLIADSNNRTTNNIIKQFNNLYK